MATKLIPFNCYVHPNHKRAFKMEAKRKGVTVADVVRSLAASLLKKHGLKVPAEAVVKTAKKVKTKKAVVTRKGKAVVGKGKKPKITSGRIQKFLERRKNESMADYVARLQEAAKNVRKPRKAKTPEVAPEPNGFEGAPVNVEIVPPAPVAPVTPVAQDAAAVEVAPAELVQHQHAAD